MMTSENTPTNNSPVTVARLNLFQNSPAENSGFAAIILVERYRRLELDGGVDSDFIVEVTWKKKII